MNNSNHKFTLVFSIIKLALPLGRKHGAFLLLICCLLFSGRLSALTRTSSASGNWNSTATWGGLSVPVAGDAVTIGTGHTVTITANAACTSITFVSNGTLTVSGTFTLDVSGTFIMPVSGSNTAITFNVGSGTVTVGGLFRMDGGSGNASKVNNLTISTGTLNLNGGFTTATTRCNVTFSAAGVLNISGAISSNPMTLVKGTGTVNYAGSTVQDIWLLDYYNLGISGTATKTSAAALTGLNGLNVANGATLSLAAAGAPLGFTGTISGTGTVLYSSPSAQTISAATYPNLEFSGGAKTIDAGATVTVNGNWIIGSATSMTTNAAAVVSANITGSGSVTMASGTINIGGNWNNNGIFSGGTGTVVYNGTTQSVAGLTYYNLQTSNSGVKTLAANTVVENVLTIGPSSTLNLSSFNLVLAAAGTPLVNTGILTKGTSTVSFQNVSSTNIPALDYYNLDLTGGPRVFAASGTIGIANTFIPGAGGFTVAGSTVNFNGSGAQTIPAFIFNDLVLSGSGAKSILTATTVSVNTINIQDGPTLDLPGTALINITKP